MGENNFLIIRIDDRLIHGQVIVGWVKALNLNRIIVVNHALLKDKIKMQMMKIAVPSDIEIEFLNIMQAVEKYKNEKWKRIPGILLLESPKDAYEFISHGALVRKINVGGLHMQDQRKQVTQNLALDEEDRYYLNKFAEQNIIMEGRALPSDEEYNVAKVIVKGKDHGF